MLLKGMNQQMRPVHQTAWDNYGGWHHTMCIGVHKAFLHVYTFQAFNHSTSKQSEQVIMAGRSHSFSYCIRSRKLSLWNHPSSLLKMSHKEKLEIPWWCQLANWKSRLIQQPHQLLQNTHMYSCLWLYKKNSTTDFKSMMEVTAPIL